MKRRDFFKIMGIASGAALSACKIDNADKKLLPYLVPPEEGIIPGVPRYVCSTCMECPAHCGINIKIQDDIPVKLEGNPAHPVNQGGLCMRGQASLARLYHPDRIQQPLLKGPNGKFQSVSWEEAGKTLQKALEKAREKNLPGFYLSSRTTGSLGLLIDEFCRVNGLSRAKELEIFHHGAIKQANGDLFNLPVLPYYHLDRSDVLVTLGADLLETFLSPVEWARHYAAAKQNKQAWFHLEPYLTLTGASAGSRLVIVPGSEPYLLAYLLHQIVPRNPLPGFLMNQVPGYSLEEVSGFTGLDKAAIAGIARALEAAKNPLIIAGGPAISNYNGAVTAHYTALLQWALGMMGNTVDIDRAFSYDNVGTMDDLVKFGNQCREKGAGVVIFSRVYGIGALPSLTGVMEKAQFKAVIAEVPGPLTGSCDLVLPLSHFLESWGDSRPREGLQSLIQPALKPLSETKSEGDILLTFLGRETTYRDYLASQWQGRDERWFQQGFRETVPGTRPVRLAGDVELKKPGPPYKKDCLFIVPSLRVYDGRGSGIALLEEIPEPLTSISYGRWISVSGTKGQQAKPMDLKTGDVVEIESVAGKIKGPVYVTPGQPAGVMTIAIDAVQGFEIPVEPGTGEFRFCLEGVKLSKTGDTERLAVLSGSQVAGDRYIIPGLPGQGEKGLHPRETHENRRYSLLPEHEHKQYRWGMAIDLDLCTGCSACAAACYIENNVPVVGKAEHLRGREMSWLRIESYYDEPGRPVFIPMMCQQCDYAPCETVCPAYATYHNDEGLNAQVYNRCVGTRYCANNCPYKARRFNWYDRSGSLSLYREHNPDISVRPKGVMEKCTFCIQRIRYAKDRAKDEDRPLKDGEVIPACAQTCPTGAIVFGNLLDPGSRVSRLVKSVGAYRILELLGTEPAIYYIKSFAGSMGHVSRFSKEPLAAGGRK